MKALKSKITHVTSVWSQNQSQRLALDHVSDSWRKQSERQADIRRIWVRKSPSVSMVDVYKSGESEPNPRAVISSEVMFVQPPQRLN